MGVRNPMNRLGRCESGRDCSDQARRVTYTIERSKTVGLGTHALTPISLAMRQNLCHTKCFLSDASLTGSSCHNFVAQSACLSDRRADSRGALPTLISFPLHSVWSNPSHLSHIHSCPACIGLQSSLRRHHLARVLVWRISTSKLSHHHIRTSFTSQKLTDEFQHSAHLRAGLPFIVA